jgi:hypothetical protein
MLLRSAICDLLFARDAVAMRIISPSILGGSIAAIPVFVGGIQGFLREIIQQALCNLFYCLSLAMSRMIVSSRLDYYSRPSFLSSPLD